MPASHGALLSVEDRHGALSPKQAAAADQPRIFASRWKRALREASSVDVLLAGMVGLSCTIADRRGGATSDVKKSGSEPGGPRQYRLATLEEAASILLVSSGGSNGQAGAFEAHDHAGSNPARSTNLDVAQWKSGGILLRRLGVRISASSPIRRVIPAGPGAAR